MLAVLGLTSLLWPTDFLHGLSPAVPALLAAVAVHLALPNMSACVTLLVPVLTTFTAPAGLNPLACLPYWNALGLSPAVLP